MTIISIANAKGGSGKTTSAALLCSGLRYKGFRVGLIDCDPLVPLYDWGRTAVSRGVLSVRACEPNKIAEQIKVLEPVTDYIIIDLSGASNLMNALSFALSDLVLVPMQGSMMDARGAAQTIELVHIVGSNRRSPIKTSVVLTRISPLVVTNAVKFASKIVTDLKVPFLPVPVLERSAYRDMFSLMTDLLQSEEPSISNLPKACRDIGHFTEAVSSFAQPVPA